MGYRIDYSAGTGRRRKSGVCKGRFVVILAVCLLLFGITANHFCPDRVQVLRKQLIPGDPVVTAAAFDTMVQRLQAGEDAAQTVTAFCREILDHGTMPD